MLYSQQAIFPETIKLYVFRLTYLNTECIHPNFPEIKTLSMQAVKQIAMEYLIMMEAQSINCYNYSDAANTSFDNAPYFKYLDTYSTTNPPVYFKT